MSSTSGDNTRRSNERTPLVVIVAPPTTTATNMSTSPLVLPDEDENRFDELNDGSSPLLLDEEHGRSETTGGGGDRDGSGEVVGILDPADIAYSANSFMAVVKPVMLTMVLSAAMTVALYTDAEGATNSALSVYEVYHESANTVDTSRVRLEKSFINAFMIVLVLAAATVVIVLMYWLRCMKCLWGYMGLSSAVLLGIMGGAVWQSALDIFQIPCDTFSFYGVLWNFAVVGVIAIFYQKGVPTVMTQGYLVCTSIIMAWQLSRFEEWTGWCLLVVLALYDLCAVLTPCGPLKALVHLMQKHDDPMPGLLYEAELPAGSVRRRPRDEQNQRLRRDQPLGDEEVEGEQQGGAVGRREGPNNRRSSRSPDEEGGRRAGDRDVTGAGMSRSPLSPQSRGAVSTLNNPGSTLELVGSSAQVLTESAGQSDVADEDAPVSAVASGGQEVEGEEEALIGSWREGGWRRAEAREGASAQEGGPSDGTSPRGRLRVDYSTAQDVVEEEGVSIKLGLGDFVFYSVLVTKAALYGFTAWAACTLVIVFGLGATLVLLAVYRMALPALPISIGLGTIFFLCTRFSMQPFVESMNERPFYF